MFVNTDFHTRHKTSLNLPVLIPVLEIEYYPFDTKFHGGHDYYDLWGGLPFFWTLSKSITNLSIKIQFGHFSMGKGVGGCHHVQTAQL